MATLGEIVSNVQAAQPPAVPARQFPECVSAVNATQFAVNTPQTRALANILCDPEVVQKLQRAQAQGKEQLPLQQRRAKTLTQLIDEFFTRFDAYIQQYDAFMEKGNVVLQQLQQLIQ